LCAVGALIEREGFLVDGRYLTARVAAEGPSLASLYIDFFEAEVGWIDSQIAGRLLGFDEPEIREALDGARPRSLERGFAL
jgi:hypothetical protein